MKIKAINTAYGGCNFRSRTEARWAVFFDSIGWKWQYEPEGFHLPSGNYLPDFYFPEHNFYAEVKGKDFTAQEKQLCKELSFKTYELYGETYFVSVFMLDGPPACKSYSSYKEGEECQPGIFCEPAHKFSPVDYMADWAEYYPVTEMAVTNALSKRFEFGENRPILYKYMGK